MGPNAAL